MHYRMLVTFDKDKAEDSRDARRYVVNYLSDDPTFIAEGRFSLGYADWFVIGGRYSGFLSAQTWAKDAVAKIDVLEAETEKANGFRLLARGQWGGTPEMESMRAELRRKAEAEYAAVIPDQYKDSGLKFNRDDYLKYGYEDDAMIVTEQVLQVLALYEGFDCFMDKDWDCPRFVDLDWDEVGKEFIGKKWVVVVDAHN